VTVWDDLIAIALHLGYPGVFLVSILGSAIPFLPLPYLAIVVILGNALNPFWVGLLAGVGAAIGKIVSYLIGRSGYKLTGESTKKNLDALHTFIARYGAFGVFLFAVSPLPDDVYIIPMGMMRLPFWKFLAANLAGKIILSILVAYFSRTYLSFLLAGQSFFTLTAAIVSTVAVSLILLKADWILAISIIQSEGPRGLVRGLPAILRIRKRQN
jgi:membrane protein DedA with SNARE-associated domain